MGSEVVVAFPDPLQPLSAVRSTLLLSSIEALRAAGHGRAYEAALNESDRARLVGAPFGSWLCVDLAMAHYRACDSLGLNPAEQMRIGRGTGSGVQQTLAKVAASAGGELDLTPWTIFELFPSFWSHSFRGGGLQILRLGPKEAEITYARCPLLTSGYFRSALRGVATELVQKAARACQMTELTADASSARASYMISWV